MYTLDFLRRNARPLIALACAVFVSITSSAQAQSIPVTLNWQAPTSGGAPTGYKVYYSNSASAPASYSLFATLNSTATLSYIFNKDADNNGAVDADSIALSPGNYWFVATAFNSSGESPYSSPAVQGSVSNAIALSLSGHSQALAAANRQFSLDLYNPGATTAFHSSSKTANAAAKISISPTVVLPASFDVKIKAPGYLAKRVNRSAATTTAFPALLAGDLNSPPDNVVNGFDFAVLNSQYNLTGQLSDFNGDGRTNGFDFAILSANYLVRGDN